MKALIYTFELLEPLLIANPISGDPNSATGLDYIPGSVVRGALAQAFTGGKRVNLNNDDQFKRLFFGDAYFLNAYPLIEGKRSLPTPRSWHREKDAREGDSVLDLANCDPAKTQLKGLGQPFALLEAPLPAIAEAETEDEEPPVDKPRATLYVPERDIRVHILQTDRRNAVREGSGDIYRYDALAAGQRFAGAIIAHDDHVLDRLAKLLGGVLKLGKSRSAGYGAVKTAEVSIQADWREYVPMPTKPGARLVVTLLSDAIVRDPITGAYTGSIAPLFDVGPVNAFVRTHVVGGFNLAWGIPLPQTQAIRAGSVFVFKHSQELLQRLNQAEIKGIGERRNEGFGRVAINWHTAPELRMSVVRSAQNAQQRIDSVKLADGSIERQLAQQMVNRMWRVQLDNALRNAIGQSKLEPVPRNAQLSRMRVLVREAWRKDNAQLILDVLKEPDKDGSSPKAMKRHARDQFEKSRISLAGSTRRLIDWLRTLADNPQTVWATLQIDQLKPPEIGGVKAENPNALEYVARLVDGVLRKAAREGGGK